MSYRSCACTCTCGSGCMGGGGVVAWRSAAGLAAHAAQLRVGAQLEALGTDRLGAQLGVELHVVDDATATQRGGGAGRGWEGRERVEGQGE
eukprot:2484051-Prymnesium_polylepis.1